MSEQETAFSIWSDYLKHLTTLATGSIVLISTFIEKFAPHPRWRLAVVLSLLGFLVAIIGALAAMTDLVFYAARSDGSRWTWLVVMGRVGLIVAWTGFCVGITSLTLFTLKNLPI